MTKEETKRRIAVMQAWLDGKTIHCQSLFPAGGKNWSDTPNPQWDWVSWDYRVKPKPREFWIFEKADSGLLRRVYTDEAAAQDYARYSCRKLIHVREVIDEKS